MRSAYRTRAARLFERELMMLVDMRAVLNDAQWNRMRSGPSTASARNAAAEPNGRANGDSMQDTKGTKCFSVSSASLWCNSFRQQPESRRIITEAPSASLCGLPTSPGSVMRSRNAPLSTPRTCHAPP